jgi:site-specific recombinase XerD
MGELRAMVSLKALPKYKAMRIHLKAAVKACGYSPKLGIHNTRHGTATQLIKNNTPLPVVQKFLGHKNIRTTMKYVHVEADDLMQAMKNLNPRRGDLSEKQGSSSEVIPLRSTG